MRVYKHVWLELVLALAGGILVGWAVHRLLVLRSVQFGELAGLSTVLRSLEVEKETTEETQRLKSRFKEAVVTEIDRYKLDQASSKAAPVALVVGGLYFTLVAVVVVTRAARAPRPGLLIDPGAVAHQELLDEEHFEVEEGKMKVTQAVDADNPGDMQDFQVALHKLLESSTKELFLDFSSQQEVSSRHIGVLVDFAMRAQQAGKTLKILAQKQGVHVFELVGLANLAQVEEVPSE